MRFSSFAACCALLSLCGCLSLVQYHGYPVAEKKFWDSVKPDSKTGEVLELLGPPVIQEGDVWLYPSCAVYSAAAAIFKSYSCDVLKVTFDKGYVAHVERFVTEKRSLLGVKRSSAPITGIHDGLWRRMGNLLKR